jgi:hypothetical protein
MFDALHLVEDCPSDRHGPPTARQNTVAVRYGGLSGQTQADIGFENRRSTHARSRRLAPDYRCPTDCVKTSSARAGAASHYLQVWSERRDAATGRA